MPLYKVKVRCRRLVEEFDTVYVEAGSPRDARIAAADLVESQRPEVDEIDVNPRDAVLANGDE